jgi:RNA polymerase sigma factor (sigma-70 family)
MDERDPSGGKARVTSASDDELMVRVREGEADALGELFARYQAPLLGFFARLGGRIAASEDLVQETFLRVLRFKHTYRSSGRFRAWLYQVARSAHADHYRKRWREQPLDGDVESMAGPDPGIGDRLEENERHALVRAALRRLPEDKREVLVMARYQGLRYQEIGDILGCAENTVKVRVHRAMKALREAYFDLSEDRVP